MADKMATVLGYPNISVSFTVLTCVFPVAVELSNQSKMERNKIGEERTCMHLVRCNVDFEVWIHQCMVTTEDSRFCVCWSANYPTVCNNLWAVKACNAFVLSLSFGVMCIGILQCSWTVRSAAQSLQGGRFQGVPLGTFKLLFSVLYAILHSTVQSPYLSFRTFQILTTMNTITCANDAFSSSFRQSIQQCDVFHMRD